MRSGVGVCGVDIGGSGCRVVVRELGSDRSAERRSSHGIRIGPAGIDLAPLLAELAALARAAAADVGVEVLRSAGVGMAGLLTLATDRAALHQDLATALGTRTTTIATDALTTLLGALEGRAGAVIAAGTGVVALGTDLVDSWHTVDGWGHVLGDRGGGAWIGAAGLRAALSAHDHRDDGSAALLARARDTMGSPEELARQVYTRSDRAAVLASFAPHVVAVAREGDRVAESILAEAARELARTAAAATAAPVPPVLAHAGGIFAIGDPITTTFTEHLTRLRPELTVRAPVGRSLDGALYLARLAATAPHLLPRHARYISSVHEHDEHPTTDP